MLIPILHGWDLLPNGRARSHIRNFLKGMHRGETVELGSRMLRQSLHALSGKHFIVPEPVWQEYLREHTEHNNDFEDVLADIGTGKLLPVVVASRLLELAGETSGEPLRVGPIAIRGNEGASLQFSPCWQPHSRRSDCWCGQQGTRFVDPSP